MSDAQYFQITKAVQHQVKIKASRFLLDMHPIQSEAEAKAILESVRKREYNANHHCYAWRLGIGDDEIWRSNDDGEPAGTAGKPIYQVLEGANITNVMAIVTRYFGGVKLGKGGLIRAYSGVVQEALPLLHKQAYIPRAHLSITCDFELSSLVYRLIESYAAEIESQDYSNGIMIQIAIRKSVADKFSWELHEASNGKIMAKQAVSS